MSEAQLRAHPVEEFYGICGALYVPEGLKNSGPGEWGEAVRGERGFDLT